jgi:hypothetical protein
MIEVEDYHLISTHPPPSTLVWSDLAGHTIDSNPFIHVNVFRRSDYSLEAPLD